MNEIWQNRVFGHVSLPFSCVKSGILYNYILFVGSFSGPVRQLDEAANPFKQRAKNFINVKTLLLSNHVIVIWPCGNFLGGRVMICFQEDPAMTYSIKVQNVFLIINFDIPDRLGHV